MSNLERLEFKAAFETDDTGAITGKAWDFASPDRVGDDILPAAFAGAIGKTMPMLFAHDQAQAVGVWDGIAIEPDGLKISGKLLVGQVVRADEVRALVKARAVTGLSIGFMTKKSAPRQGGGRTISDLELVECSLVAIPAHPAARISNVKELHMTAATAETKSVDDLAIELKAANDNIEAVTKRLDEAETKLARPAIVGNAKDEPTPEQKAFATYLRHGNAAPADEIKTLTVSSDPQGGYLAPKEMSTEMIREITLISPVRSVASVRSTGAPSVSYPKRTGITNAAFKGETQAQTGSEPAFGQVEITVKELNTYTDISNQLLADSAGQAEAEVRMALSEDFAKKEGTAFVSGDGALQPEGLMTNADIGFVVSGSGSTIAADAMIGIMYSLPAQYRNSGSWGMNGTTLAALRKLKDGQNNYLWQPSYQAG